MGCKERAIKKYVGRGIRDFGTKGAKRGMGGIKFIYIGVKVRVVARAKSRQGDSCFTVKLGFRRVRWGRWNIKNGIRIS